jgi:hypothetical protein
LSPLQNGIYLESRGAISLTAWLQPGVQVPPNDPGTVSNGLF